MKSINEELRNHKYIAVLGPNTHQWWAYDSIADEYVDIPIRTLEAVEHREYDEQEDYLQDILNGGHLKGEERWNMAPKWVCDEAYRYAGNSIDI